MGFGQAILPLNRTIWDVGAPTGWIDGNGTAPAYTTTFACSGDNGGRLDNDNEYYQVFFDSSPEQLSFAIKITALATSSLLVQESTNAIAWSTVVNNTSLPKTCTTFNYTLLPASRYVRWVYTKTAQNLTIDDVIITKLCTPPANPSGTISGVTPECDSTTLTYSAPSSTIYWQTSATGTSTTYPTTASYDVTSSGTYYVRAYNGSCWSTGTVSIPIVINYSPIIDTQPKDKVVLTGNNVTFTVATTNASSYQWQQSTDGGSTWANIGVNSNTLDLTSVPITYDGYKYKVIVNSTNCGTITSDIVTLNVFASSCLTQDFPDNTVPTGWTNNGTSSDSDVTHYGSASNCRAIASGNSIVTPVVNYPKYLRFYQDASNGGNGMTATIDYRIGAGAWTPLHSFNVTTVGKIETVNLTNISGVNLSNQINVTFRFNSNFNTWYLDDVFVFCTPCTPPTITATSNLTSGPIGTLVTISGSNFSASSTVSFNGTSATISSWTTNTLILTVPTGATDGDMIVSTPTYCDSYIPFDVFNQVDSNCQSTFNANDLFIYEVFDEDNDVDTPINYGNGGMLTIFNGTINSINLGNYRLYRTTNYISGSYSQWFSPSGTLAPGEIYRIRVSASLCSYPSPSNDVIIGFNADDGIELRKFNSSTSNYDTIDQVHTPNAPGYYMLRNLTSTPIPNAIYNASNWNIDTLDTFSCVSVGVAPTFNGGLPSIDSVINPNNVCNTASLIMNATEGYNATTPADAKLLNFEWYYNDGITNIWNLITTSGDFSILTSTNDASGTGSSTLDITNVFNKTNYQFYCRVRENDASCYTASNALKLDLKQTTWNGSSWSPIAPSLSTVVIINGNYNTTTNGSFKACNLIVNDNGIGGFYTLTITDGTVIEVENNLIVNGKIIVNPKGAFVQNNDLGTVSVANKTSITVEKETAPMNQWYEYTYWSSPVKDETISSGLSDASANRRFWFNAQNYRDSKKKTGNSINLDDGQDDVDDYAPWDWQTASGIMQPGVGYASTHDATIFNSSPGSLPRKFKYTFEGPFNNGIYSIPVYRNDDELLDNNWNFLGNPYPSAVDADLFLNANSKIDTSVEEFSPNGVLDGAIFFWSQWTPPSRSTNGNQISNFSQDDYAIINYSGQTAGGDGVTPDRVIPSGQGFFISYANGPIDSKNIEISSSPKIIQGSVMFNNSMRIKDGTKNSQFFRTSGSTKSKTKSSNKLWINLTSDNGVFNQIMVGYVKGATNSYDGMGYDTPRNLSSELFSSIYTLIPNEDKKFAIQGKSTQSLDLDEVIPLGFDTTIDVATLYTLSIEQVEGDFLTSNPMFLKDNLMHIIHDLSASNYSFTSEVGEFKDRFELVFKSESLSDIDSQLNSNKLTIIELNDGRVQFKTNSTMAITSVQIIDLLGRTLYNLKGNNPTEIYTLSNLNQAAYIAKVKLTNGQVITKKVLKRQ
jgi:hypothetical protein